MLYNKNVNKLKRAPFFNSHFELQINMERKFDVELNFMWAFILERI